MSRRRSERRGNRPAGPVFVPSPKLKLMDQCRETLRFWHYSYRTEQTYLGWMDRYPRFCRGSRAAAADDGSEGERRVAASTQNQALNALVFHCGQVLGIELGDFSDFARAQRPPRLPAVLTREECDRLFRAACLDAFVGKGNCTADQVQDGKALLHEIVSLLIGLIKRLSQVRLGEKPLLSLGFVQHRL